MQPFITIRATAAPLPLDNIDTDAITPSAAGKSTSVDLGAILGEELHVPARAERLSGSGEDADIDVRVEADIAPA